MNKSYGDQALSRYLPTVAVVLSILLMPGALEVIENAAHLLGHGDTAHSTEHTDNYANGADDGNGDDDEHGCSGASHACTCHASPHFTHKISSVQLINASRTQQIVMSWTTLFADSGVVVGVDRPPQV